MSSLLTINKILAAQGALNAAEIFASGRFPDQAVLYRELQRYTEAGSLARKKVGNTFVYSLTEDAKHAIKQCRSGGGFDCTKELDRLRYRRDRICEAIAALEKMV